MSDYQEDEFEYEFRFNVHHLGTVTIHFDENSENDARCICSRVLTYESMKDRNVLKNATNGLVYSYLHSQQGDECNTLLENGNTSADDQLKDIEKFDNSAVNATITNEDDCQLIESADEETPFCCCFGAMFRSVCKKFRSRRRERMINNESNSGEPAAPTPTATSETISPRTIGVDSIIENLEDDAPSEYSSKCENNGIKHMGFAYEEYPSKKKLKISCDYNEHRVDKWNQSLLLQNSQNLTSNEVVKTCFTYPANPEEDGPIQPGKRKRKNKNNKKIGNTNQIPADIAKHAKMKKYWNSRYRLFSKFDLGIKLDIESWYSVTPEKISQHTADRCRCDVIVDGFCGAGGNSIQFAFTCERVIAIDIDPAKIALAQHNAAIYGVADRIEFIVGDFFKVLPKIKADVVFLSPPWGGPSYNRRSSFLLKDICLPQGGTAIFDTARRVSKHIAYYLPRNINTKDILSLLNPGEKVELEQNLLSDKLVAVTAYFGELISDPESMFDDDMS